MLIPLADEVKRRRKYHVSLRVRCLGQYAGDFPHRSLLHPVIYQVRCFCTSPLEIQIYHFALVRVLADRLEFGTNGESLLETSDTDT